MGASESVPQKSIHQFTVKDNKGQDVDLSIYEGKVLLVVRVNGPKTEPVYKFLKSNKSGFLGSRIKWNFTKFLVDKNGHVLGRYGPTTAPLAIEADIKKALGVDT
ncbi:hypothetical protein QQP08_003077 [Theobroma cacao]|nr:hypothetical protein QQP08_003077 [Theobroma cacao]